MDSSGVILKFHLRAPLWTHPEGRLVVVAQQTRRREMELKRLSDEKISLALYNEGYTDEVHAELQIVARKAEDEAWKQVVEGMEPLMAEAIEMPDWSFVQQFIRELKKEVK